MRTHTTTQTHSPQDEVCMHDQIKYRLGKLCIQCTESNKENETHGGGNAVLVCKTESGIIIQEKPFYNS